MSNHPRLESWVHSVWSHRGPVACLLYPLSLIYQAVSASRRRRTVANHLPVPVVVVGNIYVGGTGKTPVTIALVRALRARGWTPGVISRGFGRSEDGVRLVTPDSDASQVGDEPLLIARESLAPVAVGRERVKAGLELLREHPGVNIIISDDGLQHAALARDVELAVIGARGLGNGWLLPAGPLREPVSRLDDVDAIILNTTTESVVESRTPRFQRAKCATSTPLPPTLNARAERLWPLRALPRPGGSLRWCAVTTLTAQSLSSATTSTFRAIPSGAERKASFSLRERTP